MNEDTMFNRDILQKFRPASAGKVKETIKQSPKKSSDLDAVVKRSRLENEELSTYTERSFYF